MMSADGTYNGYANYQTWNVCLWISNDEGLNSYARECADYAQFKDVMRRAFRCDAVGYETADGVSWNDSNVNLAELQEFWTENFSQVAY